ncbi:MAG: FAS1-like dehydratase domain-containing protein [Promethearchaeota archaeon]
MPKEGRIELTQEFLEKYKDKIIGFPTGRKRYRVKGAKMVAFAKAIGETRPEYVEVGTTDDGKKDYSKVVGHPALQACWVLDAMMGIDNASMEDDEGTKWTFDIDFIKLLHTGQEYYYEGAVPIKDGDKLLASGKIADVFIKGSPGKELLWIVGDIETLNQKKELVGKCRLTAGIRKGGYGLKKVE